MVFFGSDSPDTTPDKSLSRMIEHPASTVLLILLGGWALVIALLWIWKKDLFQQTWNEPYFADTAVLIESDDWGPGGTFHSDRLLAVLECFSRHRDSVGRCPVLTADIVLAVPDISKIRSDNLSTYHRRYLDQAFPDIYSALKKGIEEGTLVPQLHGLEHLNGAAFTALYAAKDPRVEDAFRENDWWDWESLDSPLQGHYVDGSHLPTTPISREAAEVIIETATKAFSRMFGHQSLSTVAPCYLWNSDIEEIWKDNGIRYIQTAGYRCTERDEQGIYQQDPPLIRAGDKSTAGQHYLVRNVMYEPVDGWTTKDTACAEATAAWKQALPISISTHRYNYTREEEACKSSLTGLDKLLRKIRQDCPRIRFLASPELGAAIASPQSMILNPFNAEEFPPLAMARGIRKFRPFLYRLKQRHPKLMTLAITTGLILPISLIAIITPTPSKTASTS